MKLLLDTPAFLWSKMNDPRLSASAWSLLRDPANELFLSAVSIAEIAIKGAIGKLILDVPLDELVSSGMINSQITEIHLRAEHAVRLLNLPMHHRDPFDRMLVVTALAEDISLLTDDVEIRKYPVKVAW